MHEASCNQRSDMEIYLRIITSYATYRAEIDGININRQ